MEFNFHPIAHILHKEFSKDIAGKLFVYWLSISIKQCVQFKKVTKKNIPVTLEPMEFVFGRDLCSKEAMITEKQARNRINKLKKLGYCQEVEFKSKPEFKIYRLTIPYEKGQPELHGEDNKKGQPDIEKGQPEGQPEVQPEENGKMASEIWVDQYLCKENINKGPARGPARGPDSKRMAKNGEESLFIKRGRNKECDLMQKPPPFHRKGKSPFSPDCAISPEVVETILDYCDNHDIHIIWKTAQSWLKKYSLNYILQHLSFMTNSRNLKKIAHHEKWMEHALKKNLVQEQVDKAENKKWLQAFICQNPWISLKIHEKNAVDKETGKDFTYELKPEKFKNLIQNEYDNKRSKI